MPSGPNVVKLSLQTNGRTVDFVRYDFPESNARPRRFSHWWTGEGFQFRLDMKDPLPNDQVTKIASILDSLANDTLPPGKPILTAEEIMAREG